MLPYTAHMRCVHPHHRSVAVRVRKSNYDVCCPCPRIAMYTTIYSCRQATPNCIYIKPIRWTCNTVTASSLPTPCAYAACAICICLSDQVVAPHTRHQQNAHLYLISFLRLQCLRHARTASDEQIKPISCQ